jgi:hypothetical protein
MTILKNRKTASILLSLLFLFSVSVVFDKCIAQESSSTTAQDIINNSLRNQPSQQNNNPTPSPSPNNNPTYAPNTAQNILNNNKQLISAPDGSSGGSGGGSTASGTANGSTSGGGAAGISASKAGGSGGGTFANPLSVSTVAALLQKVSAYLKTIVATISTIFIIIGGIMYMMSAGDEKMITRAKACIMGAVIGFAIVLAAQAFLNDITTIVGGSSTGSTGGGLAAIATRTLQFLLSIFGTLAIISLVVSGIMYMTASGDDKKIETAKKMFTYSIIGIVVAMSALIIITQVSKLVAG